MLKYEIIIDDKKQINKIKEINEDFKKDNKKSNMILLYIKEINEDIIILKNIDMLDNEIDNEDLNDEINIEIIKDLKFYNPYDYLDLKTLLKIINDNNINKIIDDDNNEIDLKEINKIIISKILINKNYEDIIKHLKTVLKKITTNKSSYQYYLFKNLYTLINIDEDEIIKELI